MSEVEPGQGPASGSRPAPRYGEYATPEEVARALGAPGPTGPAPPGPAPRATQPDAARDPAPGAPARAPSAPGPAAQDPAAGPRWDPAITIGLLVLGVWNVVSSIPGLWSFDLVLAQSFAILGGAPEVEPGEPTLVAGRVLLAIWLVLILGAIGLSVARLRARRLAFWVPLVAGAVAMLAMVVAMTALVFVDPGLAPLLEPPAGSG